MMPQLMKKANRTNVKMAKANFIGAHCNEFEIRRKWMNLVKEKISHLRH